MRRAEPARAERAKFTRINRLLAARGDGLVVSKRRAGGYVLTDGVAERPIELDEAARELKVERPYQRRKDAASRAREEERMEEALFVAQNDLISFLREDWLNTKIVRGQIDRAGRELIEALIEDLEIECEK